MPYSSLKQERWANSAAGKEKLGQEKVDEFNNASKGLKLPTYAKIPAIPKAKMYPGITRGSR